MKRIAVDPLDLVAVLAVALIVAGIAIAFGVADAAIVLGTFLLAYAILASRSQVTP